MDLNVITVPAIIGMAYLAGAIIKSMSTSEKLDKMIPCICGTIGLVLGLVIYFTVPGFIPAKAWPDAALIGIASGWAATGINQIYKQFSKPESPKILK